MLRESHTTPASGHQEEAEHTVSLTVLSLQNMELFVKATLRITNRV